MATMTRKTCSSKTPPKAAVPAKSAAGKTAAKPAAKAAAPVKAALKTASVAKAANVKAPAKTAKIRTRMPVSDEQRYRMIAEAAYYRAEKNQFKSDPVRDWIEAENAIATLLNG